MTSGFSVPAELLRAGERPSVRRRGQADRVAFLVRGVAVAAASFAMFPLIAVPVAVVVFVAGRTVLASTPRGIKRAPLVGAAVGGLIAGLVATSAINEAQGQGWTALAGLATAVAGAAMCVAAARLQVDDRVLDSTVPLDAALCIRHLDFAYGSHQVLFDISLAIADGEIAALLGTNGAGKSTILRAVAGLDAPVSGTIHVFGEDTTFADAEDVVRRGVALLAGGRMTFPSLTVDENLRVGAYTCTEADLDGVYHRFPALASRRQQRAGTLSGGEQQMLALGRVLLTKPRLLLIDELTLGLAPKIVEQLIEIVREVNAQGTTVLLVEQSVNLALTLAAHSFFLERGEVRFDGPTYELLTRDDLLRPVFITEAG